MNHPETAPAIRARFPFDAFAALTCSGLALGPLMRTRAFGMTQSKRVRNFLTVFLGDDGDYAVGADCQSSAFGERADGVEADV